MTLWQYDQALQAEGYTTLCGIDEAGRGPLAGPVFAAAVILPVGFNLENLNDSKKLTAKKRELFFAEIVANCPYCIASASEGEIDQINILQATFLAMTRALDGLLAQQHSPNLVLIDGNQTPPAIAAKAMARTVISGDALSAHIAAASVLAKVARDRYMLDLCQTYPQYAFEKHKGYGTKLHYQKLAQHGISPIHRRSFLKKLLAEGQGT